MSGYILVHDVGTTANKTCIFSVKEELVLIASAYEEYPLYAGKGGKFEQQPEDWWRAICNATKQVMRQSGISPAQLSGMIFCTQMQAFIAVDREGKALCPAMNYMDMRGASFMKEVMEKGWPRISNINAFKLFRCLHLTGAAPLSAKDSVWKYLWFKKNCPESYNKMFKWYDVKEYLLHYVTGRAQMSLDSAFGTLMLRTRHKNNTWAEPLLRMLGVNRQHMPDLCRSIDVVGGLGETAAKELGLCPGIKVFAGGGDAALTPIGAGCVQSGDGHIYIGTSGWVSVVTQKRTTDVFRRLASITGVQPGFYNYFAEHETSGACLKWVRDHLALDEVDLFLNDVQIADIQKRIHMLYGHMNKIVETTPVGADGVIFTPWLCGNRCPFEDDYARGMFFNIGINTGKRLLIRSVLEGIAFHQRWMVEAIEKKVKMKATLRFVGGGAKSVVWGQIISDVLQRPIEIPFNPQYASASGAAMICAVGLGLITHFDQISERVKIEHTFYPQIKNKPIYDKNYQVFRTLYKNNKKAFMMLNGNVGQTC